MDTEFKLIRIPSDWEKREIDIEIQETRGIYAEAISSLLSCTVPTVLIMESGEIQTKWPEHVQQVLNRLKEMLDHSIRAILKKHRCL